MSKGNAGSGAEIGSNSAIAHAPTFWDNKYQETRDTADHHEHAVRYTATKTEIKPHIRHIDVNEFLEFDCRAALASIIILQDRIDLFAGGNFFLNFDECLKCLLISKK